MLALSWAVAPASNSQAFWINWCQINHILLCKMVTCWYKAWDSLQFMVLYLSCYKKWVLYPNCQIKITYCYCYKAQHRAWLMCGSAIFTRLRTVCCLWFSNFYKAQNCLLSVWFIHLCKSRDCVCLPYSSAISVHEKGDLERYHLC